MTILKVCSNMLSVYRIAKADTLPHLHISTVFAIACCLITFGAVVQGLLCGTDGLPHLISDPGLALRYGHTGETLVCPCATHEFLLGPTHMHIADTGMAVCFD